MVCSLIFFSEKKYGCPALQAFLELSLLCEMCTEIPDQVTLGLMAVLLFVLLFGNDAAILSVIPEVF